MLICNYRFDDAFTRVKSLKERIKKDEDLEANKGRLISALIDLCLASEESKYSFDSFAYQNVYETAKEMLPQISKSESAEEVKDMLEEIELSVSEQISDDITLKTQDYDFARSHYNNIRYYKAMNDSNIKAMMDSIAKPDRNINVFYPRCRDGENFSLVRNYFDKVTLYGIEREDAGAREAKAIFDKVAMGSFLGARISNEVFDVMFMEPEPTYTYTSIPTRGGPELNEKETLKNTIKYLRPGGTIFYTVPYYRVSKDIAVLFARNFENVQVLKLDKEDFFTKKLILISGTKKADRAENKATYDLVRRAYNIDTIASMKQVDLIERKLPVSEMTVDTFRGSVLDMDEMRAIISKTGLIDKFVKNDSKDASLDDTEPLLPFNIGQIGLVLTSGCLDGVVTKDGAHKHIIKGRVVKTTDFKERKEGKDKITEETTSNKVEINMFMPDGTYQSLA